jgi:uncharacterized short protein YbdD (DUF466 family)
MTRGPVPAAAPLGARIAQAVRRAGAVLRVIAGVPDYERYVAHMRDRHPGAPILARGEFQRERLTARYERPGSKCC